MRIEVVINLQCVARKAFIPKNCAPLPAGHAWLPLAQHVVLGAERHPVNVVVPTLRRDVDITRALRATEARSVPVLIQGRDAVVISDAEITSRTGNHRGRGLSESLAVVVGAVQAPLVRLDIPREMRTALRADQTSRVELTAPSDSDELPSAQWLATRRARLRPRLMAGLAHGALLIARRRRREHARTRAELICAVDASQTGGVVVMAKGCDHDVGRHSLAAAAHGEAEGLAK